MLRAWQNLYVRWGTWGHALPLLTDSISICDLNDFTSYELGKLALTGNRQLLKIASSCSRGKFRPEIRGVLQKSWQTDRWECCVHLRPWGEDTRRRRLCLFWDSLAGTAAKVACFLHVRGSDRDAPASWPAAGRSGPSAALGNVLCSQLLPVVLPSPFPAALSVSYLRWAPFYLL